MPNLTHKVQFVTPMHTYPRQYKSQMTQNRPKLVHEARVQMGLSPIYIFPLLLYFQPDLFIFLFTRLTTCLLLLCWSATEWPLEEATASENDKIRYSVSMHSGDVSYQEYEFSAELKHNSTAGKNFFLLNATVITSVCKHPLLLCDTLYRLWT